MKSSDVDNGLASSNCALLGEQVQQSSSGVEVVIRKAKEIFLSVSRLVHLLDEFKRTR